MNPRFGVGKGLESPRPTPEEPPSGPEIPLPEQPVPQSEEEREDETEAATGPEMVIEEPPKKGIPSEEPPPVSQAPRGGRVFETDITRHDIDVVDAADLQERVSEANQP